MTTVNGTMKSDQPERYAEQLVSHWSDRGPVTSEDGATVQRWTTGQVLVLRPTDGVLEVELSVPDGDDSARFAQMVKDHLERFGQADELDLVWHL
jgi:uncharacterized protein